ASVIEFLKQLGIEAHARREAPGVYVNNAKIASLGLRVRKGCCYHGLALNIDMDLLPFSYINPCGMTEISITQVKNLLPDISFDIVAKKFVEVFLANLTLASQLRTSICT